MALADSNLMQIKWLIIVSGNYALTKVLCETAFLQNAVKDFVCTILEKKIARHVYPCKTTTKYAIVKNYVSFKN